MSRVRVELDGKLYDVFLDNLYKERVDNNLSTQELIVKYKNRIIDGTL